MNFAQHPDAVYLTPLGRRCRWMPFRGSAEVWTCHATFAYLDSQSKAMADGFMLNPLNFHILRPEVARAPGR